ncbi:MAG TPA: aldolase/citrate lyase family protein [Candidatus Wallbacteria bacterium]|mgnify:CR=1 FL=1|nr:MAG: Citrate lyase subunit beta [bacterium ADurb.Bin243]HOD41020.1 aldolase/citrate lyase family protein [Candidatus Wallbacteria bacterium]HPG58707.1 aldolase/citrate lyase family protein [Candidatus Wallbacteria bacterium]
MNSNILDHVTAGKADKSDVLINCRKKEAGQGVTIAIKSSVKAFFAKHIESLVSSKIKELSINDIQIEVEDNGALDFVILARLEAALVKMGYPVHKSLQGEPCHDYFNPDFSRLRRSRLYIPGNNPDLIINAGLFGSDSLILDLEDSVAPEQKFDTRFVVRNILTCKNNFLGSSERIVRINPPGCEYGPADLEMIVPARPDTLLIPKCETAEDVVKVEKIVEELERRHQITKPILFMPLIETAKGVINAYSIACASKRSVALCFGAEDFTRDIGCERTRDGKETLSARCSIVYAAKAAGIEAIDTVFSDIEDSEGLKKSTLEAQSLGFCGKGLIHPGQIKIVHEVFAPTNEQIQYANKVMQAIEDAKARGLGVIALGSKMIDAPVVERAKKTLELAKKMGIETAKKEVK